MAKRRVAITGATGVMGMATLREFLNYPDDFEIVVLARKSKKNIKKLKPFADSISIVWGDLLKEKDLRRLVKGADVVLHIGGMVSPLADKYPQKTLRVNVEGARNVVKAVEIEQEKHPVNLVYIGSVAQTSGRHEPHHWGRIGDPIITSVYDYYGISKIKAELIVAESKVKHWVSLRQSGILHGGLLSKTDDPIMFHVPLRGVLEWSTLEDSARLMVGVSRADVPEKFWCNFYNIGSGDEYRLTNYEFECKLLKATCCPPPEKIFEPKWFATRNFHGHWYMDSDDLERLIPFRGNVPIDDYFKHLASQAPAWVSLGRFAPAWLVKMMMKRVAKMSPLGTLSWLSDKTDPENDMRMKAFFGGYRKQDSIPGWNEVDLSRPSSEAIKLNHGYDETKPVEELTIEDMRQAAAFRGGECLSATMEKGDMTTPLEWRCCFGHTFKASPRSVLRGGHWCPECLPAPWRYDAEARNNPFLAQVWYDSHTPDESNFA